MYNLDAGRFSSQFIYIIVRKKNYFFFSHCRRLTLEKSATRSRPGEKKNFFFQPHTFESMILFFIFSNISFFVFVVLSCNVVVLRYATRKRRLANLRLDFFICISIFKFSISCFSIPRFACCAVQTLVFACFSTVSYTRGVLSTHCVDGVEIGSANVVFQTKHATSQRESKKKKVFRFQNLFFGSSVLRCLFSLGVTVKFVNRPR